MLRAVRPPSDSAVVGGGRRRGSGTRLRGRRLLRRRLEREAEEHLGFARLGGHAGETGLLGAGGLVDGIARLTGQVGHAFRQDGGWLLAGGCPLVRLHAVIALRQLGQRIGDGLVLDIEELLRGGNAQARRPQRYQHQAGNDEQHDGGRADQDLAVDAGDGPGTRPELQGVRLHLGLGSWALGIAGAGGGVIG